MTSNTMTPEQQRIAIAEACGWKDIKRHGNYWTGTRPRQPMEDDDQYMMELPDYLSDLDAMHEAEKLIYEHKIYDMRKRYLRNLAELLTNEIASDLETYEGSPHFENIFLVAHATAHQRAEAFLRTLNLYKKP